MVYTLQWTLTLCTRIAHVALPSRSIYGLHPIMDPNTLGTRIDHVMLPTGAGSRLFCVRVVAVQVALELLLPKLPEPRIPGHGVLVRLQGPVVTGGGGVWAGFNKCGAYWRPRD